MSEAYAGKSDQDIIAEQAASMADKENPLTKSSYNPRNTVTSEESNVNESGVEGFPGAEVSIGRTGQTGGGTSAQNIPAEEGGQDRSQTLGESSDRFEGEGDADDKRRERLANNPGGYDTNPRGIDQDFDRSKQDVVPLTTGQELQPGQGLDADKAPQN